MRRAYLLIAIPAVLVGIAYVILLRRLGFQIQIAPFLGTAIAATAAVLLVRRYHKRKPRRHRNP
jgi:membrane protein implicated in regulation of membrane protease activity